MRDVIGEHVTHHDRRLSVFLFCARVVLLCTADDRVCNWLLAVWSVMQVQPRGLRHTQTIQQAAHEYTVCHS